MPGRGVLSAVMDEALELVAPTRCVGCDEPGALLCDECLAALPWVRQELACPNCGAPHGDLTCTECSEPWETHACVCALGFLGPVRRLVPAMKDYHELRLAPVMAAAMLCALEEASAWPAADGRPRYDAGEVDAVCFVPATAAAFARRGFDHMELVARELCRLTGLPLADVLVRRTGARPARAWPGRARRQPGRHRRGGRRRQRHEAAAPGRRGHHRLHHPRGLPSPSGPRCLPSHRLRPRPRLVTNSVPIVRCH